MLSNSFFPFTAEAMLGAFPDKSMTEDIKIMMTSLYAISFLVALVGNSLGMYIIWRKCGIKSSTHLLIANLACSNLLITFIVMPMSVAFLYNGHRWHAGIAGAITCKLSQYLFVFPIATSILTILVVSVDRFFAVFYPLKGKVFRRPRIMTATIWICSAIVMAPTLASFKVISSPDGNEWSCISYFGEDPQIAEMLIKFYYSSIFAVLYMLPLLVIAVLYTLVCYRLYHHKIPGNFTGRAYAVAVEKSRRKVVKVLSMIVAAFALCWFPAHAMHYLVAFHTESYLRMPLYVFPLLLWISHTNSAIDPFLYILLSQNFRREFGKVIRQCGLNQKKMKLGQRLSRLTSNFSKRNWEAHRQSHRKNAGSSFCRSFKQADMCRMDLNENGNGNAQSVNMLNCSPIENENIEQHLDDHVL